MKKLLLIAVMFVSITMPTLAQSNVIIHIDEWPVGQGLFLCRDLNQKVFVYAQDDCEEFMWITSFAGWISNESPLIIDPVELNDTYFSITYYGCMEYQPTLNIDYQDSPTPSSFVHDVWRHYGEVEDLEAVGADSTGWGYWYEFQWSTGETTRTITPVESGIYTCEISGLCGTAIRTFNVKDNVEISLATCDLETNLNLITWPVTAGQAEYIDHLRVKRDGIEVGTANYTDDQFIDAIGSDAASRTYTLIAVATDGTECPIVSYPKETIHMSYTLGMGNTIEMGWNTPTGYDLLGYNICEWNPNDGNLSVIDFVGASVTSYTCQTSQFDNGNIVIQGVENGKTESRLLSNRSWETVGLGEQSSAAFKVYPNPSNGTFTVEGTGILRIANVLGQEIITKEINGMETIELPQGIYFVQLNDVVRKIVVE